MTAPAGVLQSPLMTVRRVPAVTANAVSPVVVMTVAGLSIAVPAAVIAAAAAEAAPLLPEVENGDETKYDLGLIY